MCLVCRLTVLWGSFFADLLTGPYIVVEGLEQNLERSQKNYRHALQDGTWKSERESERTFFVSQRKLHVKIESGKTDDASQTARNKPLKT